MEWLPQVVHAEYRAAYRIAVTFNDEARGTIDFEPWLTGPVFEPRRRTGHRVLPAIFHRGRHGCLAERG